MCVTVRDVGWWVITSKKKDNMSDAGVHACATVMRCDAGAGVCVTVRDAGV